MTKAKFRPPMLPPPVDDDAIRPKKNGSWTCDRCQTTMKVAKGDAGINAMTSHQTTTECREASTLLADRNTTWACFRCKRQVCVAFSGEGNMLEHYKSDACTYETQRIRELPLYKQAFSIFGFKPKPKESYSKTDNDAAKQPSASNSTPHSDGEVAPIAAKKDKGKQKADFPSLTTSTTKATLLQEVEDLVSRLPDSVPLGTKDDNWAIKFRSYPETLSKDDAWEVVDNELNRVIGAGIPIETISGNIRRGPEGMELMMRWLHKMKSVHNIADHMVKGKLDRLKESLKRLVPAVTPPITPNAHASSSTQSIIDVDLIEDQPVIANKKMEVTKSNKPSLPDELAPEPCLGLPIPLPPGKSARRSYPHALHDHEPLAWSADVHENLLFAKSTSCINIRTQKHACHSCRMLKYNDKLNGIIQRIETGCKPGTPYKYLSSDDKDELLRRGNQTTKELKLSAHNQAQTIARRDTAVSDHRRLIRAVGDLDVSRANMVVRVGLKRGMSPLAMLQLLVKAASGEYQVKSFTVSERDLSALLFLMGGQRLLECARKALLLPSVTTIRRGLSLAPIKLCMGYPIVDDVTPNIQNLAVNGPLFGPKTLVILMLDEIKNEECLEYDALTNCIVGTCREHSENYSAEFNSEDALTLLHDGIRNKEIHLSKESTVAGLSGVSSIPSEIAPKIIFIAGTCKSERAKRHAKFLQTLVDAVEESVALIGGKLGTVASDGCAMRGKALAELTMKFELPKTSPIYKLLARLRLLNLLVGRNDLVCDKDWKHVGKRCRNTALRTVGITIVSVVVNCSLIGRHLEDNGYDASTIASYLNPNDKQDVVLMYQLLAAIATLPAATEEKGPIYQQSRTVLRLLGEIYKALLETYTSVHLSLHEQLTRLSYVAHLIVILYRQARSMFIPSQLYYDLQIMIKNVFFCVAKAQIDNPLGKFYIILLGTDALENAFGDVRTCVGNDSGVTLLQLCNQIIHAQEITQILAKRPEWNQAPRRKELPSLLFDGTRCTAKYDHINPASWTGNVELQSVVLLTCWQKGRTMAENLDLFELLGIDAKGELQQMDELENHDMLRPFGELTLYKNVESSTETDDPAEREDGGEEEDASFQVQRVDSEAAGKDVTAQMDDNLHLEIGLEDLAGTLLTEANGDPERAGAGAPEPSVKVDPYLTISGKAYHKASLCRAASEDFRIALSRDRLRRVRADSRHPAAASLPSSLTTSNDNASIIQLDDLVVTILNCRELNDMFLAVAKVGGFKVGQARPSFIDLSNVDLTETNLAVQVMKLRSWTATESDDSDWTCNCSLEAFGPLNVSAQLVFPISPLLAPPPLSTNSNKSLRQCLHFNSTDLLRYTYSLLERSAHLHVSIPSVNMSNTFPYRNDDGEGCFACQPDSTDLTMRLSKESCHLCNRNYGLDDGNRRVLHMSLHILFDHRVKSLPFPCAFCASSNPSLCLLILSNTTGRPQLDLNKSTCVMRARFKLGHLKKKSNNNPCTNVPTKCPLCTVVIWSYNMKRHLKEIHALKSPAQLEPHQSICGISQGETLRMKKLWNDLDKRKGKQVIARKTVDILKLSDCHSSRAYLSGSTSKASKSSQRVDAYKPLFDMTEEPDEVGNQSDTTMNQEDEEEVSSDDLPDIDLAPIFQDKEDTLRVASEISTQTIPFLPITAHPLETTQPSIFNAINVEAMAIPETPEERMNEDEDDMPIRRPRRRAVPKRRYWSSDCKCGVEITESEIVIGTSIQECSIRGCETRFFHLTCLGLTEPFKAFVCESCEDNS